MIEELIKKVRKFDDILADDLWDEIEEIRKASYNDGWANKGDWDGN